MDKYTNILLLLLYFIENWLKFGVKIFMTNFCFLWFLWREVTRKIYVNNIFNILWLYTLHLNKIILKKYFSNCCNLSADIYICNILICLGVAYLTRVFDKFQLYLYYKILDTIHDQNGRSGKWGSFPDGLDHTITWWWSSVE